ncbi:MAG: hypothetical protein IPI78_18740 [Chitinophagaceae bacterium]|nr:hypothetical protein [Chitinophagaceae bacterium]
MMDSLIKRRLSLKHKEELSIMEIKAHLKMKPTPSTEAFGKTQTIQY